MRENIIIYRHIRLDTNEVFYIGIGTVSRSRSKFRRNRYWKNITNKTEYEVQILKTDLSWKEACELEIILIAYYGRKNNNTGILCNMTDGGEGSYGRKQTDETKLKISLANSGRKSITKGRIKSIEHRLKISNSKKGKKNLLNSKKVIDTSTGIIYNSIREVSGTFNINYSTLAAFLNGNRKNKTSFKMI